jgi:rfaE bifunctional protein kinase chain/domain
MVKFGRSRLKALFEGFRKQKIAVVGDLMLDRYMWGSVQRISPEAPVPVVEVSSETTKLGGAANVANNIYSLGAEPIPIGIVGADTYGNDLRALFESSGLRTDGIITDPSRPTTIKTRIIAHDQHVVRADVESKEDLSKEAERKLMAVLRKVISEVNGVILEDYNKGVLTSELIRKIIALCGKYRCFVAVDPKFRNFFTYQGVDLFKPNMRETEQALGVKIETDEELFESVRKLFFRLKCKAVLLTRGEKGMALFASENEAPILVPTRAKKIHDVSGAGDTVISTLVVARLAGASLIEAATMANYAAGIVCGEVGVVPIDHKRLFEELLVDSVH